MTEGAGADDVEVAWAAEIDRRVERILAGVRGVPWEQVEANARARSKSRDGD